MKNRKNNTLTACAVTVLLGLLAACKPTTPSRYIQPDEMEDILVEYHTVKALAIVEANYDETAFRQELYFQNVLRKHGVSKADFDSSMVYYYTRADRFKPIYERVVDRLQKQAAVLGDTEGEIGRFATLRADGDTANIWNGYAQMMLIPSPPYHRAEFTITGDSLFRQGDTFLMQFMADYLYQSGTKDGMLYVVVEYPDTIVTRQSRFTYSGLIQLKIEANIEQHPKAVRGFFYLGGFNEPSTILRLLFINNIQLIRFHQYDRQPAESTADSLTSDTVAQRRNPQLPSVGAAFGNGRKTLSTDRRNSPNRMVERIDSVKIRR